MNSHFQSSETTCTRERLDARGDRLARIEVVRADPGDAADQQHRHRRDRPDQQLEPAGIGEVGPVARAPVGRAEPEGDAQRGEDRGNHDRQHDGERVEQDLPFGGRDRPLGIEDALRAAAERSCADQESREQTVPHVRPPLPWRRRLGRPQMTGRAARGRRHGRTGERQTAGRDRRWTTRTAAGPPAHRPRAFC